MWSHGGHRFGRRGWLRPWVLGILEDGPKNGAEIIEQVDRMSFGWRPSPGSVYPLLEELTKEGLIRRRDDGRYEVTAEGRESVSGPWDFFGRRPTSVRSVVAEVGSNLSYLEDLSRTDPAKLSEQRAALQGLRDRLSKLVD